MQFMMQREYYSYFVLDPKLWGAKEFIFERWDIFFVSHIKKIRLINQSGIKGRIRHSACQTSISKSTLRHFFWTQWHSDIILDTSLGHRAKSRYWILKIISWVWHCQVWTLTNEEKSTAADKGFTYVKYAKTIWGFLHIWWLHHEKSIQIHPKSRWKETGLQKRPKPEGKYSNKINFKGCWGCFAEGWTFNQPTAGWWLMEKNLTWHAAN